MAPEQASRQFGRISIRTDIYGLGATLYTLLAGRPVFSGDRASDVLAQLISAKTPAVLANVRREVPPEVSNACMRCLAKNPDKRFNSVAELLAALDE
jgi:eukaryotic-like serine/threonine-protein kinase